MKNKKLKWGIMVAVAALVIGALVMVALRMRARFGYDLEEIENRLASCNCGLIERDYREAKEALGITVANDSNTLLMGNFDLRKEVEGDVPPQLVLIVKDLSAEEAAKIFASASAYVQSMVDYLEEGIEYEMFNGAVLQKGTDYFYMLLGDSAIEVAKRAGL